jgi:hypothetical protein
MTLRPAALSARALSVTAMVGDGLMRFMVSDRKAIGISGFCEVYVPVAVRDGKPESPIQSMKHADSCHLRTDTVR